MASRKGVSYGLKSWVEVLESKCGTWAGRVTEIERKRNTGRMSDSALSSPSGSANN